MAETYFKEGDYEPTVLTKVDIAALKKADHISFHHFGGKSYIRATKERDRSERDPFAEDSHVDVICTWALSNYDGWPDGDQQWLKANEFKSFHMIHTPSTLCWQTIAGSLRVGDVLKLCWVRGNSTEAIHSVNFSTDQLRLEVQRGDKKLAFLLAQQTGPDNTARMVQKGGGGYVLA